MTILFNLWKNNSVCRYLLSSVKNSNITKVLFISYRFRHNSTQTSQWVEVVIRISERRGWTLAVAFWGL